MKKAKVVVNQAAKQNRLTLGKKAALAVLGLVATLGVISVVVPTSNIPGFSYIAQAIGLNADATRNLTMADFASYAIGTRYNKIQELRAANLGYTGSGNYGGGLSPFATLTSDRLAEAYAKNRQEALEMEKSLGGKIAPFDKSSIDREIALDPSLLAKGFDPSRLNGSSKAAYSGAMEALAAAAGQQAEAFGKPVKKEDLQEVANIVNLRDSNISNIVGGGNIVSLASKEDNTYERMIKAARALSGTSIFGLVNPELNRTDTRIGRPVYGLFKDLGNSYFFSRYAVGAKLPTAASDIAVAAFDGGSPQDQSLITEEDSTIVAGSTNPMLSLNSSAQSVQACQHMKDVYKQTIATEYAAIEAFKNAMKSISNNRPKTPGSCFGKGNNKYVLQERNTWNDYVDQLEESCENIRKNRRKFANQCGITFEEPIIDCNEMSRRLKLASVPQGVMYIKCRDISIFDRDGVVNLENKDKRKLRKWERRYRHYLRYYKNQGYSEDAAEEAASMAADDEVPMDDDDISDADKICRTDSECYEYFDEKIEEGFAFGKIIDIKSLPKK